MWGPKLLSLVYYPIGNPYSLQCINLILIRGQKNVYKLIQFLAYACALLRVILMSRIAVTWIRFSKNIDGYGYTSRWQQVSVVLVND